MTKDKSIVITVFHSYKGPEKFAFINFKEMNIHTYKKLMRN
jgi:hypothetical protein